MAATQTARRPVKTTETSIGILELLKEADGLTLPAVAEEMGMAKSTVHRHLVTLDEHGFVVKRDDQYRVGTRFLDFGIYARNSIRIYQVGREKVDRLAEETGEKVWLFTYEDGWAINIYRGFESSPIETSARVGQRQYLHQVAAGKAILAYLPREEVDAIIDEKGLPGRTPETITDREDLFRELENIRDRGYAFNREESIEGLHSVGCPIRDENQFPIGSLSVSGPANRLQGEFLTTELPQRVLGVINEIEISLKYA